MILNIAQVRSQIRKNLFAFNTLFCSYIKKQKQMSDICLPENYAQKMFELEAALEYQGTINLIRELNDHYRAGIDYYAERESRKATHLQKKMTSLLANPDNIRILQRQAKKNNVKNEPATKEDKKPISDPKFEIHPSLNTRKLKQQVTKFHTVADTCIQNIVENSNKMADKIQRLRRKDLNKQQQQLNDRIMLKRMKSQQKIFRMKSATQLPYATLTNSVSTSESDRGQNVEPNPLQRLIQ